jgi:hypothetical protein
MSTQPFSSIEATTPKPFTTEDTEEHREELKSLLDEPWKITILPEPARLPPGVLPAPEPHAAKSLPWRRGDVTRLKDDSPEGMMRYIAMHTSGWWQELAERALRDNEKAERMAREAGWQPGQYWSLEVDAEAKQKLLDAEEARRQREEAARVKEAAEKDAFMQRQMELLKKAGRAPRCEYLYTDGRGCRAPQVKGERWCHGHAKMMSYRPEKLELEPMEDERAVMVNLYRVTRSLLAGRISEKTAGLMLWSVAIGMPGARRLGKPGQPRRTRRKILPRINADERRSGKKVSREVTRMNTNAQIHAGVTNDKSFVSGVDGRVPPVSGDPVIGRSGDQKINHKGHEGSRRNASKEIAREEQSSGSDSIRVDPRQSAVSSCSSSVSPCLGGGIDSSRREVLPPRDGRFSLDEPPGSE